MLTRTSEYTLRALICLAQQDREHLTAGKDIAEKTGVPSKYLSKILGDLVRAGVLESTRGTGGGFRLTRPAEEIPLLEVIEPYERFDDRRCPFGNKECSETNPCLAHEEWKKVLLAEQNFLKRTSVASVAHARDED